MKPTTKHFVNYSLPYIIILVAITSVIAFPNPVFPFISLLDNTAISWVFSASVLIILFLSTAFFYDDINRKNTLVITFFFVWTVICIVRGFFVAENYWDVKALITNIFGLLLIVVAYSATNKVIVQTILLYYVKYALPLFLVLIIFINPDAYGFYLVPVSSLLLFIPALSRRSIALLSFFTAVVFIADLGARSNVIKFAVPALMLFIFYFRDYISNHLLEIARLVLITTPIVLFILGVTGLFNVFHTTDYLGEQNITKTAYDGTQYEENLAGDTRTFIYEEVITSALNNDYWIFGRTPARGNDSASFGAESFALTRRYERIANEVGVANVFTWMGLVGVVLYFLVFFRASFLAVNRSNNIYAKMLGIYIAFRWLYSWVEDVNNFSLNYFMLWIMIGMCFSVSFRLMTDYEVTIWIRGVFDKRYLNFDKYLKKDENE